MLTLLARTLAYIWALPASMLGLLAGGLTLLTGGKGRWIDGTLEFWGGFSSWFLMHCMRGGGAMAMTLGHVIVGRNIAALQITRTHELVHVRQYERWGPFFIPVYLACSLILWLCGKCAYRDNPFEREAFERS